MQPRINLSWKIKIKGPLLPQLSFFSLLFIPSLALHFFSLSIGALAKTNNADVLCSLRLVRPTWRNTLGPFSLLLAAPVREALLASVASVLPDTHTVAHD